MIERLDHVNICTAKLEDTVRFYEEILGLVAGPAASSKARPGNVWLYAADGRALIHVNVPTSEEGANASGEPSGLDHFAFTCTGLAEFVERLHATGSPYTRTRLEQRAITQITMRDPNGVKVELAFSD